MLVQYDYRLMILLLNKFNFLCKIKLAKISWLNNASEVKSSLKIFLSCKTSVGKQLSNFSFLDPWLNSVSL